ncbi:unnamed protein product [Urochloa humidicola]
MGRSRRCGMGMVRLRLPLLLLTVVGAWMMQGCIAQGEGVLTRGSFPQGFVFGTASSAYQVCLCCGFLDHLPHIVVWFMLQSLSFLRRCEPTTINPTQTPHYLSATE